LKELVDRHHVAGLVRVVVEAVEVDPNGRAVQGRDRANGAAVEAEPRVLNDWSQPRNLHAGRE
jgi:hypothetical protein